MSEGETTAEEFAEEAEARGIRSEGCTTGGPPDFMLCVFIVDRTLVVVPFEGEPGMTVRINDPGLIQDVVIPLDTAEAVGVRNLVGPDVEVRVEYLGEETSSFPITSLTDEQS